MENEIWKQCGESDKCFYEVSNMGKVKSITKVNKKERILKGRLCKSNGYLQIQIIKNVTIHSLVAYAFLGPRPDGLLIDHIDRNKQNNCFDNLRYYTKSENAKNSSIFRTDILEEDIKERNKILYRGYHERDKIVKSIKINCPCGSITNKSGKLSHEKTEKHKKYLNTLL